jgi:aspartyl-tRNA(Asn)/glutamyl-tRNA(Gln) amidotransferase subunit A
MTLAGRTFSQLARDLGRGSTTSRALAETALEAIEADGRAFCAVDPEAVRVAADASDTLRRVGAHPTPFAGIPVSVKDLFDVAGQPTPAGSAILREAPPAGADAPAVARLRAAGLVVIGRTQMSEFAFTGLGLNPHSPQPVNPLDAACAPGGSSGGAAVSVALGQAVGALGTDTGGSVRVPAAFCGLVGFKPTQARVTRAGVFPLSPSQDSIGPLAWSVACCRTLDAIIADAPAPPAPKVSIEGLRLGAPEGFMMDGCDRAVLEAFDTAVRALADAGAQVTTFDFPELSIIPQVNVRGSISNAEAFAIHRRLRLLEHADRYDPMVRARIELGGGLSAADYLDLLEARATLIDIAAIRMAPFDAVICPTVAILPPRIDVLHDPAEFSRLNMLALRNTSVVNLLDRCAITLPLRSGHGPCGLMMIGERMSDLRLLALGEAAEACLRAD